MSRHAQLACGALLALSVMLPAGGCRQIAAIDDPTPPPFTSSEGGVASCGVSFASSDCAACIATSCCAEASTCGANPKCNSFAGCLATCATMDVACTSACRTKIPSGYGMEAAELQSCVASRCASACQVTSTCGGYVYPDADCASCSTSNCCELATACVGDVECSRLSACERDCVVSRDSATCLQTCEVNHPSGVTAERAFGTCLSSSCRESCVDPHWACLKHPTTASPSPSARSIGVTYQFTDYKNGQPIPGLNVRACGQRDFACEAPVASTVTGQDGRAVLALALNAPFVGFTMIGSDNYGPVYLYLPPLSKDFVVPSLGVPDHQTYQQIVAPVARGPVNDALLVRAFDCTGIGAAGARFAIDAPASQAVYFVGGIPEASATATAADEGSDGTGGYGGFFNVPANTSVKVQATVVATGVTFPPVNVVVRASASAYTEVLLYAAPP